MILAFVLLLVLVALSFEMVWLPALFCAVAAMHWTASLHLPDPLAPLYAFFIIGLMARMALMFIGDVVTRRMRSQCHRARRRQGTLRFSP